uniref:Uncharacterized protein n=1 Tax=Acrobeloides nanus TaxID=290746 RepID=A0A914DB90_9BILA
VLCNAPCPPVNLPPPANSFTSDGVYQNDPVLLAYLQQNQDEAENEQDPQLRKMVPISPPRPKPSFPAYAAAFASNAFTDLYQESVNGKIDEAGKKVYTEAVSKSLMEDLIKEQVDAQAEEVLFMARLEYKQKLAELEKERFKEMINKYINDEADAILGK